jgi:hypothetical protein
MNPWGTKTSTSIESWWMEEKASYAKVGINNEDMSTNESFMPLDYARFYPCSRTLILYENVLLKLEYYEDNVLTHASKMLGMSVKKRCYPLLS